MKGRRRRLQMGPRHQETPTRNRPLDWKGLLGFGFSTKVGECRDSEGESSTHTNTQTHTDGDSLDGQPRQKVASSGIALLLTSCPPPLPHQISSCFYDISKLGWITYSMRVSLFWLNYGLILGLICRECYLNRGMFIDDGLGYFLPVDLVCSWRPISSVSYFLQKRKETK